MKLRGLPVFLIALSLAGCMVTEPNQSVGSPLAGAPSSGSAPAGEAQKAEPPQEPTVNFARETVTATLHALPLEGLCERDAALVIYNYLIGTVFFTKPIGLDIWRYRSEQDTPLTYVENRSLSPLLFGVGSCEDFAAALTLLLEEHGIPAHYVAGYTLSVKGKYTDHAWVVAQIDGDWFHFDPQLEQNLSLSGHVAYRFFMKSDAQMKGDHLWGEALIDYCGALATEDEIARIRADYSPPACVTEVAAIPAAFLKLPPRPDIAALEQEILLEKAAHTPLAPMELQIDPPVLVEAQQLVKVP